MAKISPELRRAIEELEARQALLRRLPPPETRRWLRKEAGITGHSAAQMLGVSDMAFSFWERGERIPRDENLDRYVEFLDELRRVVAQ
jgi:hypothetical protein